MYVDFKIEAWERVTIPEEMEELIKEKLASKEIETSNELIEFLDENSDGHFAFEGVIDETEVSIKPENQDGYRTIEMSEKGREEVIFTNGK
jgi:hypothetical protein